MTTTTINYYQIRELDPPLLILRAPDLRVTLACGYLDALTYTELEEAAMVVRQVRTFAEMLERRIAHRRDISMLAYQGGVRIGMTGREALAKLGITIELDSCA